MQGEVEPSDPTAGPALETLSDVDASPRALFWWDEGKTTKREPVESAKQGLALQLLATGLLLSAALVTLLGDGELDTTAAGHGDHGLAVGADDEDVGKTGGEVTAKHIADVDDVEATEVTLLAGDDTDTTHVATTSDHDGGASVEGDEVKDLLGLDVESDSVVDLDGRVGVSDGAAVVAPTRARPLPRGPETSAAPRSGEGSQPAGMPAQKRPHPSPDADDGHVVEEEEAAAAGAAGSGTEGGGGAAPRAANGGSAELAKDGGDSDAGEDEDDEEEEERKKENEHEEGGGSGGDDENGDDSQSSESDAADMDEFILVKLMDIRKEVQCPICLGIIRKTRTVMECLHRFCRDCIDKSMRLGNNECPACRTHCKSRRSLRDDPNFDALILALYPDIDKYEEEELAFGEEEKTRNKKIQDSIAETFRRQTEALVKKRSNAKAIASSRKTRGSLRTKKRGRTSSPDNAPTDIDDDEREENGNDGSKESSSVDDRSPDVKMKRARRWPVPRSSPAKTIGGVDSSYEENDDLGGARDILATSPLRGEMLAWGKNGTRSQTRHGNPGGSSGRMVKGGRVAKLVDHLRNADEFDTKFNLYLALTPLDGQSMPKLEKSYLSCQPTFSVSHLCQFVAFQLSRQAQEVEIYFKKKASGGSLKTEDTSADEEAKPGRFDGLERLKEENSLSELYPMLASGVGDLELLYSVKAQG